MTTNNYYDPKWIIANPNELFCTTDLRDSQLSTIIKRAKCYGDQCKFIIPLHGFVMSKYKGVFHIINKVTQEYHILQLEWFVKGITVDYIRNIHTMYVIILENGKILINVC